MKKTVGSLLGFTFLVIGLCLATTSVTFAQPLEEEEEPVQARPNPMDKTMHGKGREQMRMKGRAVRNASERGLQRGKALGAKHQVGPVGATDMDKVSADGHKKNSDDVEGLERPNPLKNQGAMMPGEMGDTPGNPVSPTTSDAAKAFGWGAGDDVPTNPVSPMKDGLLEMNTDFGKEFGGENNIGF